MAIPQNTALGFLNRIASSLTFPSNTALNVIGPNLGPEGISFNPTGGAAVMLNQTTGRVISENPYMPVSIDVQLIRTQALCATWISQIQTDVAIGDIHVTTDSSVFPDLYFENAAIITPGRMAFNGSSANMTVTIEATWVINSSLWSAA